MTSPLTVFLTGIFGVFFGMAFLYLSIKATGAAAAALEKKPGAGPTTGPDEKTDGKGGKK